MGIDKRKTFPLIEDIENPVARDKFFEQFIEAP